MKPSEFYQSQFEEHLEDLKKDFTDRSCLVLGSAPEPVLDSHLLRFPLICVNSSGYSAALFGRRNADLTLLRSRKLLKTTKQMDRDALRGLKTKHLVLIVKDYTEVEPVTFKEILDRHGYSFERVSYVSHTERTRIIQDIVGPPFGEGHRDETKPSNGVFAICLAFKLHVRDVLLSGFSFSKTGHNYSRPDSVRHHITPDKLVFDELFQKNFSLRSTERELCTTTRIPLYCGEELC